MTDDRGFQEGNKKKTAVFTKEADKVADEPNLAFFDFKLIGGRAGDWVATIRQDLENRFGNVEVVKTEKRSNNKPAESPLKGIGESLQQVHPMTVMNEQVKNQAKALAKEKAGRIAGILVEASIYCAVFHHAKQGLKHVTRDRKYSGPAVRYASDVMLPNGLYGPIFGFLIRLTLPF